MFSWPSCPPRSRKAFERLRCGDNAGGRMAVPGRVWALDPNLACLGIGPESGGAYDHYEFIVTSDHHSDGVFVQHPPNLVVCLRCCSFNAFRSPQ